MIREILGYEPRYTGTNLKLLLETLSKVAKRRSVAFVVSDFFASGYERALSLAAAKHDVIPVMLVDPRDEELPDVGLAIFEDLETGEEVLVDTSDARVRDHYKKSMRKAQRAARVALFNKLALDFTWCGPTRASSRLSAISSPSARGGCGDEARVRVRSLTRARLCASFWRSPPSPPARCPTRASPTRASPTPTRLTPTGGCRRGRRGRRRARPSGAAAAGTCVEHVPPGAKRPVISEEGSPPRGLSGYAAEASGLVVTHGKGETVLPEGFRASRPAATPPRRWRRRASSSPIPVAAPSPRSP